MICCGRAVCIKDYTKANDGILLPEEYQVKKFKVVPIVITEMEDGEVNIDF